MPAAAVRASAGFFVSRRVCVARKYEDTANSSPPFTHRIGETLDTKFSEVFEPISWRGASTRISEVILEVTYALKTYVIEITR